MENPTAQTAAVPLAPEPPQLSSHTLFELRQLMQWYETKLLADPEHAENFREYLTIAAAADAIKCEHARLNIPESSPDASGLFP